MPDIYATISEQPPEIQERVVEAMRLRADEPEMQAMLERYLSEIDVPDGARVLEIGCGGGVATQRLATLAGVSHVTGLDPSPVFLARAREAMKDQDNVDLVEGDARALQFDDSSFDLLVAHTVLSHVPEPEAALKEACRVLRPGGQIVVFDGDYATMNMAIANFDPLQPCIDMFLTSYVNDPWFMRRLPKLATDAGFQVRGTSGHGYVKISDPQYLLTVVDRGADALLADGCIGPDFASALRAEAHRRVADNQFYGVIMFGSLVAEKPS